MYNEAGKYKSAQALFNLGFMHQFGAGLPKDHHLAKRFYDRCCARRAVHAVHAPMLRRAAPRCARKERSICAQAVWPVRMCRSRVRAHLPAQRPRTSLPPLLPSPPHPLPICSSLKAQRDAKYAVQAALLFLRLHGWWEGVQSRLPPKWADAINARLFTLQGAWGGMASASLCSRALGLWGLAYACPAAALRPAAPSPDLPRRRRRPAEPDGAAPAPQQAPASRHGVWPLIRQVLTLDFLFASMDDLFEAGDNVDLTVGAAVQPAGGCWGCFGAGYGCCRGCGLRVRGLALPAGWDAVECCPKFK